MDIRNNIKTIRERLGLSQYELAFRMELDQSSYSRLEKRGNKLSIEQIKSICDAMKVDIYEVLNGTIESNTKSSKTSEDLDNKIDELEALVLSQKNNLEDKETILKYTKEQILKTNEFLIETFETLLLKLMFENKVGKIINIQKGGAIKKELSIETWNNLKELNKFYFGSNSQRLDSVSNIHLLESEIDIIFNQDIDTLFSEKRLLVELANMETVQEKFNNLFLDKRSLITALNLRLNLMKATIKLEYQLKESE